MTLKRFSISLLSQLKLLMRLGKAGLWLSTLLWLVAIAPAQAAVELRVAIKQDVKEVTVGSSTQAVVKDGSGRSLGAIAAMNAFVAQPAKGGVVMDRWQAGQFWVEPSGDGYVFIGDRWYRGKTLVIPTGKGLTAVNYVDVEQYLYSVLGGEMNGNWPQEALKAQAVAARSYALYQRQRSNGIFDVGDTPRWQVYKGILDESVGTQTAVRATDGQVLTYSNQIIEAVFHSSAGGCTENVEDVWTQALPYLRSVKEGFNENSPVAQWQKAFSRSELSKRITGVGNIVSLIPAKVTTCGRISTMRVVGDSGKSRLISGDDLRLALDLKSTLFTISPQQNSAAKGKEQLPAMFQVDGRGFGHGLGMSQWGAYNMAQLGANYQQILLFYYKNTALAKIQVQ